MIKELDEEKE